MFLGITMFFLNREKNLALIGMIYEEKSKLEAAKKGFFIKSIPAKALNFEDKPLFTAEFLRDWNNGKEEDSPLEVIAGSIVITEYALSHDITLSEQAKRFIDRTFKQLKELCCAQALHYFDLISAKIKSYEPEKDDVGMRMRYLIDMVCARDIIPRIFMVNGGLFALEDRKECHRILQERCQYFDYVTNWEGYASAWKEVSQVLALHVPCKKTARAWTWVEGPRLEKSYEDRLYSPIALDFFENVEYTLDIPLEAYYRSLLSATLGSLPPDRFSKKLPGSVSE